ncbi:NAD(P)-binding protein [Durotheca rogersii]|uniref:NAD(P)-binding protein n=1 Tax=Durotheca rogersii TaxID=419775 RepID=UPI0022201429|nr:NAD(P)-binding protein [Durotheca rogersii]KAI5864668.1 NAD(P)-binding protein [Durotheca rogersii]
MLDSRNGRHDRFGLKLEPVIDRSTIMATEAANIEAVERFTKTRHRDTYEYISTNKVDLYGRSVFIAGASKGIGRETALSFAAAGCCKIGIGARSDLSHLETAIKEAAKKAGRRNEPRVVTVELDVTSEDSVRAASEIISNEFEGRLDVLVNNAGFLAKSSPVDESGTNEWWSTYEINVKGTFMCSKYFIPLLLRGDIKTNILVSSIGAMWVSPGASAYQTSKLAVCRLAEFIAAEYQGRGLACFALHPGGVKTELSMNLPETMHRFLTDEPQLSGDSIVWLSKERRPWLSGRYIDARWDMAELEALRDDITQGDLLKVRLTTSL